MIEIHAECKFCHKPISLSCDDEYDAIGDPQKLVPLAACNDCADVRVLRRILEKKIQTVCGNFNSLRLKEREESEHEVRKALNRLTTEYCRMIARFHKKSGMAWDDAIVNQLIEHPDQWADVLGRCWKMFKESVRMVGPQPEAPLPYKDE